MPSGYSGTPLAKKLGIKAGYKYLLNNQPEYYFELFSDLPEGISEIDSLLPNSADFIHLFCKDITILHTSFELHLPTLKKNGTLWISWPKKSSGIQTDIDGNVVRNYLLSIGLVDVKVAAVDEIMEWTEIHVSKKGQVDRNKKRQSTTQLYISI